MRKITLSYILFIAVNNYAQTNDSLALKNKELIDQLKNRITTIDNIGNGNNSYQKQIDELKIEMRRQNDSINKLLGIINDLKKHANSSVSINSKSSKTTNFKINDNNEFTALNYNSLNDADYNKALVSDVDFATYKDACNCTPLLYKPYETKLTFKEIDELNILIKSFEATPNTKIIINGHADKSGDETKNIALSKQRAENLKKYLIIASDKIKANDIILEYFGSEKPISDLPRNKQFLNRRTEILLK